MKKRYLATALLASLQLFAAEQKIGTVNFANCITESKLGKQEQTSLETMRKQFATLLEDTQKQHTEIDNKLKDKDYLDGLSPEAEKEMRTKQAQLEDELNRYNQQYYQFMHQGQNKLFQTVLGGINQASEKLASGKGYTMIINKEACFYCASNLDVTADVIKEMDKNYDADAKNQPAPTATTPAVETKKVEAPVAVKEEAKKPAETAKVDPKKVEAPVTVKEEAKPAVAAKAEDKKNAKDASKSR